MLGDPVGLLVWPTAQRLFLVDASGFVSVSADSGETFNIVGEIGGEPAAFMALDSRELYVALHDGRSRSHTTQAGSGPFGRYPRRGGRLTDAVGLG